MATPDPKRTGRSTKETVIPLWEGNLHLGWGGRNVEHSLPSSPHVTLFLHQTPLPPSLVLLQALYSLTPPIAERVEHFPWWSTQPWVEMRRGDEDVSHANLKCLLLRHERSGYPGFSLSSDLLKVKTTNFKIPICQRPGTENI